MKHLVAAALLALSLPCVAQSDDAARGALLYEDTPGTSGNSSLTASCTNCHGNVQNRRLAVGGSAFADISFDEAMTAFVGAVNNLSQMAQYSALPLQDARDLATYIADTPKTTAATLDFTATATDTATTAQTVDLRHSVAPIGATSGDRVLNVTGVTIGGADAARFTLASNACAGAALQANNTCRIGVTFSSPDTAGKTATLTIALRQGTQNFSRTVALTGAVAVSTPPTTPAAPADEGGGALGFGWLAALALATAALRRTRAAD